MTGSYATGEGLNYATRLLAAVSATPRLDAELLLAHALGVSRDEVVLGPHRVPETYPPLIARRLAHEPVAYIIGERDFWTLTLRVTPAVLIPRPDSETLIEAAIAHFGSEGPRRILDLGTGSGALLLAALDQWPSATGIGVDASAAALAVAQGNADRLGFAKRATFRLGDWTARITETFDLILCNPPYVEDAALLAPDVRDHEPHAALFAGPDGLDAYRVLLPQVGPRLAKGGVGVLEIGSTQAEAVAHIARANGFDVAVRRDLAGHERCLVLSHAKRHLSLGDGSDCR